jgi:heptosyltransferase III
LQRLGCETVTFSKALLPLTSWFPEFRFEPQPSLEKIEEQFASFDAILLQHDNTPNAKKIRTLPKPVYVFYGSHLLSKHGPLRPQFDAKFNPAICMAENIRNALRTLFPGIEPTLENGLAPPHLLQFRRFQRRIALHPTSTSAEKNWPKDSFLKLQDKLQQQGWDPVFIVPPKEAASWRSPLFPQLSDLATFLFESGFLIGNDSGPGHLASNLGLPTVIILLLEARLASRRHRLSSSLDWENKNNKKKLEYFYYSKQCY